MKIKKNLKDRKIKENINNVKMTRQKDGTLPEMNINSRGALAEVNNPATVAAAKT